MAKSREFARNYRKHLLTQPEMARVFAHVDAKIGVLLSTLEETKALQERLKDEELKPAQRRELYHEVRCHMHRPSYAVNEVSDYSLPEPREIPTIVQIARDISIMRSEFEAVIVEPTELSVITKPITLGGIYFGQFQIKLQLDKLTGSQGNMGNCYRVIALEPNRAYSNNDVTHPHVLGETMCTGDTEERTQFAVYSGQLYMFFTIIGLALETYNSGSPHVRLENWSGDGDGDRMMCDDCGRRFYGDDMHTCEHSDHNVCSHCASYCEKSDAYFMRNYMVGCDSCSETYFQDLVVRCTHHDDGEGCDERLCSDCRDEHEEECSYKPEEEEEEDVEQESTETGSEEAAESSPESETREPASAGAD
jgi:hypothetical protein